MSLQRVALLRSCLAASRQARHVAPSNARAMQPLFQQIRHSGNSWFPDNHQPVSTVNVPKGPDPGGFMNDQPLDQIERFEQSHLDNEVEPFLPWEELNYRNWKYSYNMIWTGIVTSILVFWWEINWSERLWRFNEGHLIDPIFTDEEFDGKAFTMFDKHMKLLKEAPLEDEEDDDDDE